MRLLLTSAGIKNASIHDALLELWERLRTTVVFVTHSVTEAAILSDRVIVMAPRPGRVAADVAIDLPRPRTAAMEDDPEFHEIVRRLRTVLREQHQ